MSSRDFSKEIDYYQKLLIFNSSAPNLNIHTSQFIPPSLNKKMLFFGPLIENSKASSDDRTPDEDGNVGFPSKGTTFKPFPKVKWCLKKS